MVEFIDTERKINITNPNKLLWPELGITKIIYAKILTELSPFLLPYTSDRILTVIRYPDNIHHESFYQKRRPVYAPSWIDQIGYKGSSYINLNKLETLLWLGNSGALEFHVGFSLFMEDQLNGLVFDLDPSEGQNFDQVIEAALVIHEELKKLNLTCYVKTSGASGLQLYLPINQVCSYEQGRQLNTFFAKYFSEKYPNIITIERSVKKRGALLYFDYLQMWKGKTIISAYSPRAVESGAISTPVTWKELEHGIKPSDFNLNNIIKRLKEKGDLFNPLLNSEISGQDIGFIMQHLNI